MVLNSGAPNKLGTSTALSENPENPTLGARSIPRTPEVSWESDEEDSVSVLDLVEDEATPVDQPRLEDKVFGTEEEINALGAGQKLHVDNAARVFNKIKSRSTVVNVPLSTLPEGVNRTLYRVATSRIRKKNPPAPPLTCRVCQVTVTGTHQLRQHQGGERHFAREARYKRETEDHYCATCERFFPSAHDLASYLIGANHRRRVLYLRDRKVTCSNYIFANKNISVHFSKPCSKIET